MTPDYRFFTAVVDYLTRDPDPAIAHAAIRLAKVMPKPAVCPQCGGDARYQLTNGIGRLYKCPSCEFGFYSGSKG